MHTRGLTDDTSFSTARRRTSERLYGKNFLLHLRQQTPFGTVCLFSLLLALLRNCHPGFLYPWIIFVLSSCPASLGSLYLRWESSHPLAVRVVDRFLSEATNLLVRSLVVVCSLLVLFIGRAAPGWSWHDRQARYWAQQARGSCRVLHDHVLPELRKFFWSLRGRDEMAMSRCWLLRLLM